MDKQNIGSELKAQLMQAYDVVRISRWALRIFSSERILEPELRSILETILSMEDDPQFELSSEELTLLAKKLIAEGKREELGNPDPTIQEVAQSLGNSWMMCPVCQEAWEEETSEFGMVCCPTCKHKLHNPNYGK